MDYFYKISKKLLFLILVLSSIFILSSCEGSNNIVADSNSPENEISDQNEITTENDIENEEKTENNEIATTEDESTENESKHFYPEVFRELDYCDISLSNPDSVTRIKTGDIWLGYKVELASTREYLRDEEWSEHLVVAMLDGEFKFTGNFSYNNVQYDMLSAFEFDDISISNLPTLIISENIYKYDKMFCYFIPDSLDPESFNLNNLVEKKDEHDRYYLENVEITLSSLRIPYSYEAMPIGIVDGTVVEIKDVGTGEVIYSAPTEVEHAELL